MPDHIHLLVGLKPNICVSDLVRDIKAGWSKFINESNWLRRKFNWQNGFGSFSYSKSEIDNVIKYILKQEEHHKKASFKEEYLDLLIFFEINYNHKYLFEWIDWTGRTYGANLIIGDGFINCSPLWG
jgi:hypothetical protein